MKATFIAAVLIILALISSVQAIVPAAAGAVVRNEHDFLRGRVLLVKEGHDRLRPVAMKCPEDNDKTFELLSKNQSGLTNRIRVVLEGNTARSVSVDVSEQGKPFQNIFHSDLRSAEDPDAIRTADKALGIARKVLDNICNGTPSEKDRFKRFLSENLKEVGG